MTGVTSTVTTTTTAPAGEPAGEEVAVTTTTGETATATTPSARGRVRDATSAAATDTPTRTTTRRSRSRSRSRSRLRTPKTISGIKLKGMVKTGWKSMRKLASNNRNNSDLASRTSTDHESIGWNSEADGTGLGIITDNNDNKVMAMESLLNSTVTTTETSVVVSESALELVLLLMDPISRRFELLQLEFDSCQAKVSDLLTQIPLTVTEPKLQQEQLFVGVLDYRGQLEEGSTRLWEAFGNHTRRSYMEGEHNNPNQPTMTPIGSKKLVLVAKPKGLSTKETMRLAKPILTYTQVEKMVRTDPFQIITMCMT
jgi:hypothetical protein